MYLHFPHLASESRACLGRARYSDWHSKHTALVHKTFTRSSRPHYQAGCAPPLAAPTLGGTIHVAGGWCSHGRGGINGLFTCFIFSACTQFPFPNL